MFISDDQRVVGWLAELIDTLEKVLDDPPLRLSIQTVSGTQPRYGDASSTIEH